MSEDRCISCGAIIPEGRMVCPSCENGIPESVLEPDPCDGCFGAANEDCKSCDITYAIIKRNLERKAKDFEMAEKKNSEGYQDPTAYGAERSIESQKKAAERRQKAEEAEIEKRCNQLVGVLKLFADFAGFEIEGRIHLKHKRTGKEFR